MATRRTETAETGSPWTRLEDEAAVSDYLDMLVEELSGRPVNKAEHNRRLRAVLTERSKGSIEFKHANISAAMIDLGYRYVDGYKPRPNYQDLLRHVIEARMAARPELAVLMSAAADAPEQVPEASEVPLLRLVAAPKRERGSTRIAEHPTPSPRIGHPNYLLREALNGSLGLAGELAVLVYEDRRLRTAGKKRLAERIDHVSRTQGDGLGYDVQSFDENGAERLIEVKTTRGGVSNPFFATRNEVDVSDAERARYHLYRVFAFDRKPQLFTLQGSLRKTCLLEPLQYRAEVA